MLFADWLPPAIIDFSPYWRPPAYATAIVVGDALTWEGADERLLETVADVDDFGQYLLRAVIFRLVADRLLGHDSDCFDAPAELALRLAAGGG